MDAQRLGAPLRQPFLSFAAHVQLKPAIYAINAFMVPSMTLPAREGEKLAEPISGIAIDQFQQLLDNRSVPIGIRLVVVDCSAKLQGLTCRTQAHLVLFPGDVYQLPFLRRP